jgi:hypothetical protein
LAGKHKSLEQDMAKLAEANAAELSKLCDDLDLETRNYTEYRQNVQRQLDEVQETVALSFDEVKAQCMSFPEEGIKVDKMFDWVVGEVKAVPDTIWRLSDNFTVFLIC